MQNQSGTNLIKIIFTTLSLLFILTACGSDTPQTATTPTTNNPTDNITVQLDWLHTIEYAGFYVADANNYFAENNLSVDFRINDGSTNVVDVLANGDADFGVTGADTLLVARENGIDLVAVATIYQVLPVGFMSLAENGIQTPEDLAGRTVMLAMGRTSEFTFNTMINAVGMDASSITVVPRTVFNEEPLFNGEVDVIDVFVTNQVVQMRLSDTDVNVILPLDYGVEMYVNVIATTQTMIDENPELVQRFVSATLHGLQDSVADADKATDITMAVNPELNRENEMESMHTSLPLIQPVGSQPGQMSDGTWTYIHDMLLQEGILSEAINVSEAYNQQFVEAYYSN